MTKSRLLQLIQSEREVLAATLAQVREDQMDEPGVCGAWSVKDVLAHIVAWEELMVRCLREIQDLTVPGLVPYGISDDALDELNEQIREENRGKPLDQVLKEFERSYEESVTAVEATPEEELLTIGRVEGLGNEPLWHMVAANTCWHYRDHRELLEAWHTIQPLRVCNVHKKEKCDMTEKNTLIRWGAVCAIVSGVVFLVPLVFYFYLLPAAGSSATHAQDPSSFLPWMATHGGVRVALWWTVCLAFVVILFGVPSALRRKLESLSPTAAQLAELAGILGPFTIILASLILAAGELPLAHAYVAASEEVRPAIVAIYEWQRLATALLFDVFGLLMLGVWILVGSVAGLRSGGLPKGISWFGIVTALLSFSVVTGYITKIEWLGEAGLGALAFLAVPAWLIWLGIVFWKASQAAE
jgi:uncharacterized protein (TIGR03083 family)